MRRVHRTAMVQDHMTQTSNYPFPLNILPLMIPWCPWKGFHNLIHHTSVDLQNLDHNLNSFLACHSSWKSHRNCLKIVQQVHRTVTMTAEVEGNFDSCTKIVNQMTGAEGTLIPDLVVPMLVTLNLNCFPLIQIGYQRILVRIAFDSILDSDNCHCQSSSCPHAYSYLNYDLT